MSVRCRFAPAPSGSMHVGNARTGLFSWLFARHHGGTFILRVEDTDASRVTDEAIDILIDSLRWLGIDWDEGPEVGGPHAPYRQTERLDIYREKADALIAGGHAYHCFCTKEELEERRAAAMARHEAPGYDGRCRTLTDAERRAFEDEERPAALRFHMEDKEYTVHDLVRGDVHFAAGSLRDFVILRSDGSPTYLLAAAVDDLLMEMTHVIRGEDLLPSTPRQLAILDALGAPAHPTYAHLPLIVGADHKPLSKRHGSVAVEAFREQGYLPEALVNYLALLGWSKDESTTFLSRDELIEAFDLDRVSHNPAAFDTEKLEWMNGHYIKELQVDDLAARLLPFFSEAGVAVEPDVLSEAVPLINERMKFLPEAVELLRFLFTDDIRPNEKAAKLLAKAGPDYVRAAATALEAADPWTAEGIMAALDGCAEAAGLNRTKGWQPVRAAVTGSNISPPLPESLQLLGRERTLARVRSATG
ncbi:MAG: glutamate--tRNA ligase [Actinomycetota bacterium]